MTEPQPKPVEEPVKRGPYSAQDKKTERRLISLEQLLLALLAEPADIAAELAEGGYTPKALTDKVTEQKSAFGIFVAQGEAKYTQTALTKAFKAADRSLRTYYRRVRAKAKSAFMKDPDGRGKLRLNGTEPNGLNDLIGAGRALVLEGSKPEFATRLAAKGVSAATLTQLSGLIDALEAADLAQEKAKAASPTATAERDAAAQNLFDWEAEFKMFAKGQFGDRPEILRRWGVIK
jgi:hypothetical protein